MVRVVAVDEDDDLGGGIEVGDAGEAGLSVAGTILADDADVGGDAARGVTWCRRWSRCPRRMTSEEFFSSGRSRRTRGMDSASLRAGG